MPDGAEVRVNTFTADRQVWASVACGADGDFVVAWMSEFQDGSDFGVYAQRFTAHPPPTMPAVTQVFLGGTAWADAFKNFLQASGTGNAACGFAVPGGAGQSDELPWSNLNQVSLRFSAPVLVQQDDLRVRGVNVADYPVTAFAYDPAAKTATWTLGQAVANDRLTLTLDADSAAGVTDAGGTRLDGDWSDGVHAYPSGDGAAGGDFRFALNVLPGDVDGNGTVVAADVSAVKRSFFRSTASPGTGPDAYSVFRDLNGSGAVLADDFSAVKQRFFTRLPDDISAAAIVAASAATCILRDA